MLKVVCSVGTYTFITKFINGKYILYRIPIYCLRKKVCSMISIYLELFVTFNLFTYNNYLSEKRLKL